MKTIVIIILPCFALFALEGCTYVEPTGGTSSTTTTTTTESDGWGNSVTTEETVTYE